MFNYDGACIFMVLVSPLSRCWKDMVMKCFGAVTATRETLSSQGVKITHADYGGDNLHK